MPAMALLQWPSSVVVVATLTLLLCATQCIEALSLPGLAANAYERGHPLRAEVNGVRSTKNPVQLDFYSKKLPYSEIKFAKSKRFSSTFDLGALLSGERHKWSPFVLPVGKNACFSLGETTLTPEMIRRTRTLIKRRYRVQVVVDDLPAINKGVKVFHGKCDAAFYKTWPRAADYQRGYYVGVSEKCNGRPMLNNHVHFKIGLYPLDETEREYFAQVKLKDGSTAMRQSRKLRREVGAKVKKGEILKSEKGDAFLVVSVNMVPYSINWASMAALDRPYKMFCDDMPAAYLTEEATTEGNTGAKLDAMRGAHLLAKERSAFAAAAEEDDEDNFEGEDDLNDDFWESSDDEGELDESDELPEDFFGEEEDEPAFYDAAEKDGGVGQPNEGSAVNDGSAGHRTGGADTNGNRLAFLADCDANTALYLPQKELSDITVRWSYSVSWKESRDVKWATRWDSYFKDHPMTVKQTAFMLSILLSLAVIAALMSLVAAVLVRALRRDLLKSAPIFLSPEDERVAKDEELGWKSVRGDVFRPPPRAHWLIVAVSAGAQALLTLTSSVLFGLMGFASPQHRGRMVSMLLFFFLLSSFIAGALCAWLSLALGQGKRWATVAELVLAFSGVLLAAFTGANIVLRMAGSSGAVPVAPMMFLYMLWLFVCYPLTFLGAAAGFAMRYKPAEKVAAVQRVIDNTKVWSLFRTPQMLWYSGLPSFFVGMLLIRVLLNGMWGGVMMYAFGFLTATGGLWVLSCALTSVAVVYYNLCGENHRWHWLSVVAPSSAGLPPAAFVLWYYFANMRATTLTAILLYAVYMSVFTYVYVVIAGAVGFLSSLIFVHFIYSSSKID